MSCPSYFCVPLAPTSSRRPLVGKCDVHIAMCCCAAQFGEIDIDSELVASKEHLEGGEDQQIMMLNNGCLCCTVNDDLIRMLAELVSPHVSDMSW